MNVYQKLSATRVQLQELKLKKSGLNKFAGYDYYQLGDFIPACNKLAEKNGLCPVVSFTEELATMTIYDSDKPEDCIVFTSPMSEAKLKGVHEVQNLGAVETYERRYLYQTAFEIVENDWLDASEGADTPAPKKAQRPIKQEERPMPSDEYINATAPQAAPPLICEECGNPVKAVKKKDGTVVDADRIAAAGYEKWHKALCVNCQMKHNKEEKNA